MEKGFVYSWLGKRYIILLYWGENWGLRYCSIELFVFLSGISVSLISMSSIAVSSSPAVCIFSSFWLNNPWLLSIHVVESLCKLQDGEWEQYVYCRKETHVNANKLLHRFYFVTLHDEMWCYRHCLHHFCYIGLFQRFLWKVIRGPFECKLFSWWSCARACETRKQCYMNNDCLVRVTDHKWGIGTSSIFHMVFWY